MKILYLGDDFPHNTSGHRAAALGRLGHEVTCLNPRLALPAGRVVGGLSTRVGLWPFVPWINARLIRRIGRAIHDLAWIDAGAELSPGFHRWLRRRGMRIINYNVDDPYGIRDGRKWDLYRRSVPWHDLTVVVRTENIEEARTAGARKVVHVFRSYDPVAHAPLVLAAADRTPWNSDVIFVGSWMPERGPFLLRLLELGVPLTIRGDHWAKAPEWPRLRDAVRGPAVYGADYVRAVQCSKVSLGMLSKGNRDLHTQRSAEIPFIAGGIFCAERTADHLELFRDGQEAVFWTSVEECARHCTDLLARPGELGRLAEAARKRVIALGLSNDCVLQKILGELGAVRPSPK